MRNSMIDFVFVIGNKFPNVQVSCVGDANIYSNLIWEGGSPLPSEEILIAERLTIVREQTWARIKAERDRRKAAGIKVGSMWFHSDDTSRIQQIALTMLGANLPAGIMWKTMSGTFTEMTSTLAAQIFQMNIYYDKTNFANAEQHRQLMLQSADPLNYDCSAGWLQSFEDANPGLSEAQLSEALAV